jgi:hypothetical protein
MEIFNAVIISGTTAFVCGVAIGSYIRKAERSKNYERGYLDAIFYVWEQLALANLALTRDGATRDSRVAKPDV